MALTYTCTTSAFNPPEYVKVLWQTFKAAYILVNG